MRIWLRGVASPLLNHDIGDYIVWASHSVCEDPAWQPENLSTPNSFSTTAHQHPSPVVHVLPGQTDESPQHTSRVAKLLRCSLSDLHAIGRFRFLFDISDRPEAWERDPGVSADSFLCRTALEP
ncbi:unnamed protein product, partial [Amoebophrya sp. A25]|eukprot:GSA25T00026949001.1